MNRLPKHISSINYKKLLTLLIITALVTQFSGVLVPQKAQAVDFTKYYVFLDRMTASTNTGGTVCAKPASTNTEADVQVTFAGNGTQGAASFGVNSTAGNWTVSTTNLPTTIQGDTVVAWDGIDTATAVSGATVTFPSNDLTVGTLYCFHFNNNTTLSTPTSNSSTLAVGNVKTRTNVPGTIDSSDWSTAIVSAGADQVTVTATVAPTFSFAISQSTTCALGTLQVAGATPNTCSTAPRVDISTNAKNGYTTWVKNSSSNGLTSSTSGGNIASNGSYDGSTTDIANTSGYVLDADATAQSPTIMGEYNGANNHTGGHLDNYFQTMAYKTAAVANAQVTMNLYANAAATTPAASDYTDTLTVAASGSF